MILVTGGTGVMGSVLVRKLAQQGETVRVLTLPGDPTVSRLEGTGADIRFGRIEQAKDLDGICDGVDTVYHLAAIIIAYDDSLYRRINVEGTRNLVSCARAAGVKHFVLVSSASVVYPLPTPYSSSKQEAEEIVRSSGIPFTIVRPTLVYDKGRGGIEYDAFLEYLRRFAIVPFIGNGNAVKRPVFVDDIVNGLVSIAGCAQARGKTLNFSGAELITMKAFARLSLKLMGMGKKRIVYVPVWLCRVMAALLSLVMKQPPLRWPVIAGVIQDADLDPAQAMEIVGYQPKCVTEMLPLCFPRVNERKLKDTIK